jgi:exosortase/archaeosortase family protein
LDLPRAANGQPYLPDNWSAPPGGPAARSRWLVLLTFLVVFAVLQAAWTAARDTQVERLVIDRTTVAPAVLVISAVTPHVGAVAEGSRIRALGGGINILHGCDGLDTLFLLFAGLVAAPMGWRRRLSGMFVGTALVYVLNQLRILGLFYALRSDPQLFELLHGTALPLILVAAVALFFLAWTGRTRGAI